MKRKSKDAATFVHDSGKGGVRGNIAAPSYYGPCASYSLSQFLISLFFNGIRLTDCGLYKVITFAYQMKQTESISFRLIIHTVEINHYTKIYTLVSTVGRPWTSRHMLWMYKKRECHPLTVHFFVIQTTIISTDPKTFNSVLFVQRHMSTYIISRHFTK